MVTNTYDGSGDQLSSCDSTVGGSPEKWLYDGFGNATKHWDMGTADNTVDTRATRDTYDGQSRVIGESLPGNSSAPGASGSAISTYDDAGNLLKQTNPNGSWTSSTYDGDGNETSETQPTSGYSANHSDTTVTTESYDDADNLTGVTAPPSNAAGLTTTNAYDLLQRETGATGSVNSASSTTEYNNLDWVLKTVDADGVTDAMTYDSHGNVVSETIGSRTTTSTYDADNNLKTQTDADGNLLTNTYDAFGNLTEAKHTNSGGTVLKDVTTTVDSLGRPTLQSDSVTGLSHSWTYPVNSATGTQETVNYDSTPLTSLAISCNAREMETSRVATIASGNTVTRAVADSTAGRDTADRWISSDPAGDRLLAAHAEPQLRQRRATLQPVGGRLHER